MTRPPWERPEPDHFNGSTAQILMLLGAINERTIITAREVHDVRRRLTDGDSLIASNRARIERLELSSAPSPPPVAVSKPDATNGVMTMTTACFQSGAELLRAMTALATAIAPLKELAIVLLLTLVFLKGLAEPGDVKALLQGLAK